MSSPDDAERGARQSAAAISAGARHGCRLRGRHDVGLCDGDRGRLPLKRRARADLEGATPGRRKSRGDRASSGVGRHRQRACAAERGTAGANGKPDDRTRDGLIVAVAHFDDRGDGGLLLNDVDGAFALEDHDLERGGRRGLRGRIGQPQSKRRARPGLDGDQPAKGITRSRRAS